MPDLTVRENVRVGRSAARRFSRAVDNAADREAVRRTYDFLGLDIDPEARVASLTPSERVSVAVARALQDREEGSGVIVFDESSRAIPPEALPAFHDMVRFLAAHGTSVLFVSHDLKEVLALAHRVTALRNGRVVETGVPVAELDEAALTRLVLGRDGAPGDLVGQHPPRPTGATVEHRRRPRWPRARLHGHPARGRGRRRHRHHRLRPARPARPAGRRVAGGRTHHGRRHASSTSARTSVPDLLEARVVMIPQDRHERGLATALTVEENITIPHVGRRSRPWSLGTPGATRRPTPAREVRRTPPQPRHRRRYDQRRQPAEGDVRQVAGRRAAPAHARGAHPGSGRRRPRRAARGDPYGCARRRRRAASCPRRSRTSPPSATACSSSRTASSPVT